MADSDNGKKQLAARLIEARKLRGIDRSELARLSGIPYSTISAYEQGKRYPKSEAIDRLADALGVTAPYLRGEDDDPTSMTDIALSLNADPKVFQDLFKKFALNNEHFQSARETAVSVLQNYFQQLRNNVDPDYGFVAAEMADASRRLTDFIERYEAEETEDEAGITQVVEEVQDLIHQILNLLTSGAIEYNERHKDLDSN